MTSANAWRAEQRAKRTLTPLNLALNAAYNRCQSNGGHMPSGDTITREFAVGQRALPICAKCGVPITKPRGWATVMSSARGGRR